MAGGGSGTLIGTPTSTPQCNGPYTISIGEATGSTQGGHKEHGNTGDWCNGGPLYKVKVSCDSCSYYFTDVNCSACNSAYDTYVSAYGSPNFEGGPWHTKQ